LKAFAGIMAAIYVLALFGVWVGLMVPFIGTPIFLASLYLWYIPGILFAWTGFFAFHEFGAAPTGMIGHIVMFLFYAAIAWLLSLPFAQRRT
jgi:hypothetical protein